MAVPDFADFLQLLNNEGFSNYDILTFTVGVGFETNTYNYYLLYNVGAGYNYIYVVYIKNENYNGEQLQDNFFTTMADVYNMLNSHNLADIPDVKGAL